MKGETAALGVYFIWGKKTRGGRAESIDLLGGMQLLRLDSANCSPRFGTGFPQTTKHNTRLISRANLDVILRRRKKKKKKVSGKGWRFELLTRTGGVERTRENVG